MSQGNNNITNSKMLESANLKADLTLSNVNKFYHFHKFTSFTLTENSEITYDIEYTPQTGKALYLSITGDQNPTLSSGGWTWIKLFKNGILLTGHIVESNTQGCNVPFCLSFLDVNPIPCTYTFTIKQGARTGVYGEDGDFEAPQIVAFEV